MLVQLTMVIGSSQDHSDIDVEREGEDDGIVEVAPVVAGELTSPVMINTDHVRNFYPRKKRSDGHHPAGTRITFSNGSGMAVTELFDTVSAKMGRPN